jgi:integrase
MAWLQKKVIVRWLDAEDRRVTPKTPGARRVKVKSKNWYMCWRDGNRKRMIPLFSDKKASEAEMRKRVAEGERRQAGLDTGLHADMQKPISEQLAAYIASMRTENYSDYYVTEAERIINLIIEGQGIATLATFTVDKLDAHLNAMTTAAATKKKHRSMASAFMGWVYKKHRRSDNPMASAIRPEGQQVRKRRALKEGEVQRLLDAARRRPLESALVNRGGRNNNGAVRRQFAANVRPEVRERLVRLGRERALIYKTALFTGLRRGELTVLRVGHLDLDAKPNATLQLPEEFTKNGQEARLLLLPDLAAELRQWIADTGKNTGDLLFVVPSRIVGIMKRDLKAAGIDYKDALGRFSDFHALRGTGNTLLGKAGVHPSIRQKFMRHSDIKLTTGTYDDKEQYELAPVVEAFEKYDIE